MEVASPHSHTHITLKHKRFTLKYPSEGGGRVDKIVVQLCGEACCIRIL